MSGSGNFNVNNPMLGAGIGILGANAPSLDPRAGYFGYQLMGGLRGAQQSQMLQTKQKQALQQMAAQKLQQQAAQQQMNQQQAQAVARAQMAQGLPPAQKAYAAAYPQQFGKAYGSALFPKAQTGEPLVKAMVRGPDGKPTAQFVPRSQAAGLAPMPGQPLVSMVTGGAEGSVYGDEEKERMGFSKSDVVVRTSTGPKVVKSHEVTAGEAKQIAQADISQDLMAEIDSAMASGNFDPSSPFLVAEAWAAKTPLISWATKLNVDEARGVASLKKLETILLAAMRGAQVGPAEQAVFREQLPSLGQAKALFSENLRLTKSNLVALTKRLAELRGYGKTTGDIPAGWTVKEN